MATNYFFKEAQVLTDSGRYKSISDIKEGDLVLNMHSKPVKVLQISKFPGPYLATEIRHSNWFEPFYCSNSLEILIAQDIYETEAEGQWKKAEEVQKGMQFMTENDSYATSLAPNFEVSLSTSFGTLHLAASFNLGLLFGLYAGYGAIEGSKVLFQFGPNEELVNNVVKLLKDLLLVDASLKKDADDIYTIEASGDHLIELFSEFGSRVTRNIPSKFWSSNKEYVAGLFKGLVEHDVDSKMIRYIPVSKEMATVFAWICSIMGVIFENNTKSFLDAIYPLFAHHDQPTVYLGKILGVQQKATALEEGWNMQVDCPTGSFIVNNLIVRGLAGETQASQETVSTA